MIQKVNDKISVVFTEEGFTKSNSILIEDDLRILIDSGPGKVINDIAPESVDILINSHCHLDHVWDNDRFINSKILMHPLERENLKDHAKIGAIDSWSDLMDGDPADFIDMLISVKDSFLDEWRVDGTVDEGEVLSAGSTEFNVMHTPGHTSGHLSFFFPEAGLLFCGDICLTKVGPWYGDASTPVDDFIRSIDRIIDMKPERVVSGHNRRILTDNIPETFIEYRDRIYKREKRILKALTEKPQSIDELASLCLIYPAHPSIFVLYWEKSMLVKHLQRMLNNSMIEKSDDGRYIVK
jgi:glyoxylase-like metal-dependent hydrolase (beta-lactamase superfamily II)